MLKKFFFYFFCEEERNIFLYFGEERPSFSGEKVTLTYLEFSINN
jgi:hypothetical protein